MNIVFLIGRVATNVDFDFMINSTKHISIACFKIRTLDKQVIDVILYDGLADFVYSNIKLEDFIFVYGCLDRNSVIVKQCKRL